MTPAQSMAAGVVAQRRPQQLRPVRPGGQRMGLPENSPRFKVMQARARKRPANVSPAAWASGMRKAYAAFHPGASTGTRLGAVRPGGTPMRAW